MGALLSQSGRRCAGPLAAGLAAAMVAGPLTAGPLGAQTPRSAGTYSMAVRGVAVSTALDELVRLTGVSLVYSSEVVEGRTTVCRAEEVPSEALLRCIVEGAGLDFYQLSSGTYVVIAAAESAPAYGTVSGRVLDAMTGEPVPFASVEWADGGDRILASSTGVFVLTRLLPGPLQLLVSGLGYLPSRLSLEVPPAGGLRREISLTPSVVQLDPILVEGMEGSEGLAGGGVEWRADRSAATLPRQGDVTAQARTGLGVARRPFLADLSIQGSAPGEHMVRLDGVPVFDPVSLGRTRSAFSPLALRRITVRKSGYGVDHGSFTGGVIDIEQRVADGAGRSAISMLADPYGVDADASLPLRVMGGEGSVMVAGRSSFWNVYAEPTLSAALRDWNRVDPVLMRQTVGDGEDFTDALAYWPEDHESDLGFSDLHGALQLRFDGFRTLRASFYRGTNRVGTRLLAGASYYADPLDPGADGAPDLDGLTLSRDVYDWSNFAGRVRFDWLVGDRAAAAIGFRGSRHTLEHRYGMASELDLGLGAGAPPAQVTQALQSRVADGTLSSDGNRAEEWAVDLTGDVTLGGGHSLRGGVEGIYARSRTHMLNPYVRALKTEVDRWRWSAFVTDSWRLGKRLTLEGGVRVTDAGTGTLYDEPRVSLRWDQASGGPFPWSLQVAAGRYHQFVNQFELTNVGPSALVPDVRFWLPYDGSVAPPQSRHLASELLVRPAPGLEVRAEAYHKWLDRILALDYAVLLAGGGMTLTEMDQADFVGTADGVAYGAGASVRWERDRTRLGAGYEWSQSERTFPSRFDGRRQPVPWNQPHRLSLEGRIPLWSGLALEGESQSVWGRTWGLRRAYYDFLVFHGADDGPVVGLPGDDPLPALHQVDVGISWLGRMGGLLGEVRAEVRNLLGDRNVLDRSLQRTDRTTTGVDGEGNPVSRSVYREVDRFFPSPGFFLTVRLGF